MIILYVEKDSVRSCGEIRDDDLGLVCNLDRLSFQSGNTFVRVSSYDPNREVEIEDFIVAQEGENTRVIFEAQRLEAV